MKCPACDSVLYRPEVERNLQVCPKCAHHMRIGARQRLMQFLDPEEATEIGADVAPEDPLRFRDSKRYRDRLAAAQKAVGERDAFVVMAGKLEKILSCAAYVSRRDDRRSSVCARPRHRLQPTRDRRLSAPRGIRMPGGCIRYTIRGAENAEGRPCLAVGASGTLRLTCHRCLGALEFTVELAVELELATSEQAIAAAEDEVDRVLATRAMDVASLVEDEVLLALPIAPTHERCEPAGTGAESSRASAFAALAGLRKSGGH